MAIRATNKKRLLVWNMGTEYGWLPLVFLSLSTPHQPCNIHIDGVLFDGVLAMFFLALNYAEEACLAASSFVILGTMQQSYLCAL